MIKRLLLAASIAALLAGGAVPAQASDPRERESPDLTDVEQFTDQVISSQLRKDQIPGASVIVVKDGKQVLSKGYGLSNVEKQTRMDPERDVVFTASEGKLFTALAVLQLVEKGKLDLRADVNTYLKPDERIGETFPGKPVTLHHLLTHTGGFDEDLLDTGATEDPKAAESLATMVKERRPERKYAPGTVVAYDNFGFDLAGLIVERTSGQPYADYVQKNIFDPIGMRSTSAQIPHPAALHARLAAGYRRSSNGLKRNALIYNGSAPSGSGPVTTAGDLGRFMAALLEEDPRIGKGAVRMMKKEQYAQHDRIEGMAYGFQGARFNGVRELIKSGDLPGYHHSMTLVPELGIGIYVTYNGDGPNQKALANGIDFFTRFLDRYSPAMPKSVKGIGGDVSTYAGTYVSSRTSEVSPLKLTALVGPATVAATGPGELETTGISHDPGKRTQRWTQIGEGYFVEKGGKEHLAFDGDVLVPEVAEAGSFRKTSGIASPTLHMPVLLFGAAALLLAFLVIPILALVRRLRSRTPHPVSAKVARVIGWVCGFLTVGFILVIVPPLLDIDEFNATIVFVGGIFVGARIVAAVLAGFVLASAVFAVLAWRRSWWTWLGRTTYSLLALGGIAFVSVLLAYNLVQLPSLS